MPNQKNKKSEFEPLPIGKKIIHVIVLIAGWCLYFYLWWQVFLHIKKFYSDINFISIYIIACLIINLILTYSWISHNRRIFRKKGPRKSTLVYPESYTKDWLNIPIYADWEKLKKSRKIFIKITPNGKFYYDNDKEID